MNLVEAVFVFSALSALIEAVLILKMPIRARLRLLGDHFNVYSVRRKGWWFETYVKYRIAYSTFMHAFVAGVNCVLHIGSVVGSMTIIVASLTSFAIVPLIRKSIGYIDNNVYYPGWKTYSIEQPV